MRSAWQRRYFMGFVLKACRISPHTITDFGHSPPARVQYGVFAASRCPVVLQELHALRCERRLSPYRSIGQAGPASGTLLATVAGVHLVEVLIAASLLAGVCLSLPTAFVGAVRANLAAGEATWTTVLAAQKVEELRSGPFPPAGRHRIVRAPRRGRRARRRSIVHARLPSRLADRTTCVCARQHSRHHGSRRAVPARRAECALTNGRPARHVW